MTCERVNINGAVAIVCTGRRRRRRCGCGRPATLECDWKVPGRRSGTCDAPICERCTTKPAAEKDLCPKHATDFRAWSEQRQAQKKGAAEAAPVQGD